MSNQDGQGRVQERLKEGGIVVDDRENPIKWIDDVANDLKNLIQFLPILTNHNTALFSQHIMQQFNQLLQAKMGNQGLNMIKLIRNETIFIRVY